MNAAPVTKQSKQFLIQRLAKYFKVPKDKLISDVEEYQKEEGTPIVHSVTLEDYSFNRYMLCLSEEKVNLNDILYFDNFAKSGIYKAFLAGEEYMSPRKLQLYTVSLHLKGTIWFIYRQLDYYRGRGGISINNGSHESFAIVPIKNYLHDNHGLEDFCIDN